MRTRMELRLLGAALVLVLVAGACSTGEEPSPQGGRGDANDVQSEPQSDTSPDERTDQEPTGTVTYEVWFARGERLAPSWRTEPSTPRVGTAALESLLAGPTAEEGALTSSVPDGTSLRALTITDGEARVDLDGRYEAGGGSLSMNMRLAQVVFTLTQFPTVDSVSFLLDGRPVDTFSGEGIVIDEPLTRADFEDLAPPITVDRPRPRQKVANPVVISGTANVFEATVSIRILDADGETIKETFTTATCGTGCRGDYTASVRYSIDEEQDGTIQVFESSAEDGRPLHMVEIPVTLSP